MLVSGCFRKTTSEWYVCGLEPKPFGASLDDLAELGARPHDDDQWRLEPSLEHLLEVRLQRGSGRRGSEEHVAGLDVGPDRIKAGFLERRAQIGHRDLVATADVDPSQ